MRKTSLTFATLLAALLLVVPTVTFVSCGDSGDKELRATVDSFSVAYFNWQFPKAAAYADAPSRKWLAYLASQVSQEDVDSLRSMPEGAKVEVKDVIANDSTATATVEAHGFLSLDSIGRPPHTVGKATMKLRLIRHGEGWRVALRGL